MAVTPRFISAATVSEVLTYPDLILAMEKAAGDFSAREKGGVVQPVRSVVPVNDHKGDLAVMPGYSAKDQALATKLVTLYPNNTELPSHQATILLFRPSDGSLLAVMDGEVITAMRTAAMSAVATKYLSPANPEILCLIGAGTQAKSHYYALTSLYYFKEIRVYNRTYGNAVELVRQIGRGRVCESAEEAVRGADVIVTVTFSSTPVLEAAWVKPGAHINAVGSSKPVKRELPSDLMTSSVVYVDSYEGANKEAGDIILSQAKVYAELGEVINGMKTAYRNKTTVFKSLGMAVEDVVSAKLVNDKVSQKKHLQNKL